MKGRIFIPEIFFFLFIFHAAFSQHTTITFNLVEGNGGAPLRKVNAITQDPKGYIWMAGQGAYCLYRYDGTRFISFSHDSSNPNSLGSTSLETVFADNEGLIWIGFGDLGLDQYNPATGIFTHYRHDPDDPASITDQGIVCILKDSKGRLWLGGNKGLDRLDIKTGKFTHYKHDPGDPGSLSSSAINKVYEDRNGTIWVGTGFPWFKRDPMDGGLNRLEDDGSFTRYMHDPKNPNSLINNKVRSIFEDSRGIFWIGTNSDGLHTMDRTTGRFERHRHNPAKPEQLSRPPLTKEDINDPITFIHEDISGAIWIGTRSGGISRYDTLTRKITNYRKNNGFPDGSGWNAFSSRDGVLWICTEEGNVYRIDPSRKPIPNIDGPVVNMFLEDNNGFLWAASDGKGLWQYDRNKKKIHQYLSDPKSSTGLFNDDILSLYQSGPDSIWFGTYRGMGIFNPETKLFSRFEFDTSIKRGDFNPVTSIFRDKSGMFWFTKLGGTKWHGLIGYNAREGTFKKYINDPEDPSSIGVQMINNGFEDASGDIWVGGYRVIGAAGGISRLNKLTGRFTRYLENIDVNIVYKDVYGTIWAGTRKGLYRFDNIANRFVIYFDPHSELFEAGVHGITEDEDKNLWMSTSSAIVKINPERDRVMSFSRKYGIVPNFLIGTVFKKKDGELLVGNNNGFYFFYPHELAFNIQSPAINITGVLINTQPLSALNKNEQLLGIENVSHLSLAYSQNNIAIRFAVTDYRAPESNKYFTRLEGFDSVWHETGAEKAAYYYNVSPGDYVFRVKAFDSDGAKMEKVISIHIELPWWKTWWAYLLYGLTTLAAVFIAFRIFKQRIIQRERQKSQEFELAQAKEIEKAYKELKATQAQLIQSEKMASLGELTAGIAHEIQNPLNFVNNFAEINTELIEEAEEAIDKNDPAEAKQILADLKDNEKKIRHHGQRADAIVKNMLQHSRTSAGQKELTDINALADEYLRLAYHGLRAKDKSFNVTLHTDFDPALSAGEAGTGKINIIPQDIGRVLLNLYNNAFFAVEDKKKTAGVEYQPRVTVTTKLTVKSENPHQNESVIQSVIRNPQSVIVSVKDNGNGIPENMVSKIFQPFFTTKPTGKGTGLGLSLSYDIIKAHGGEINVTSTVGEGAEFIITLPVNT